MSFSVYHLGWLSDLAGRRCFAITGLDIPALSSLQALARLERRTGAPVTTLDLRCVAPSWAGDLCRRRFRLRWSDNSIKPRFSYNTALDEEQGV